MIGTQHTGDVVTVGSAAGVVTLVEGRTICLSSAAGDVTRTPPRVCSCSTPASCRAGGSR